MKQIFKTSMFIPFVALIFCNLSCTKKDKEVLPSEQKKTASDDNRLKNIGFDSFGYGVDSTSDSVYVLALSNYADQTPSLKNITLYFDLPDHAKASLYSGSKIDLTSPKTLTVTSENGNTRDYIITGLLQRQVADVEMTFNNSGGILTDVVKNFKYNAGGSIAVTLFQKQGNTIDLNIQMTDWDFKNVETGLKDSICKYLSIEFLLKDVNKNYSGIVGNYLSADDKVELKCYTNSTEILLEGTLNISSFNSLLNTISGSFEAEGPASPNYLENLKKLKVHNGTFENIPIGRRFSVN